MLLVLLFVVIATFSVKLPFFGVTDTTLFDAPASISFVDLTCVDRGTTFRVCANALRTGGAYAKIHIAGGTSLDVLPKETESVLQRCEDVTDEVGYKIVRGVVYDASDHVLFDQGVGVLCERRKPTRAQASPPPQETHVVVKKQFTAENKFRRPLSADSFSLDFGQPVSSCTFEGTWRTQINSGYNVGGKETVDLPRYCHGAEGSFFGALDATQQWVVNDPKLYEWRRGSATDPSAQHYDDRTLFVPTCDLDMPTSRYAVEGIMSGVGTPTLTLGWTYKDSGSGPQVFFDVVFDCVVS